MLSKSSVLILKFIKECNVATFDELKNQYPSQENLQSILHYLADEGYIEEIGLHYINLPGHSPIRDSLNEFRLFPKGESYLENIFQDNFLKYYPLALSTFALIVSVLALLKSFGIIF